MRQKRKIQKIHRLNLELGPKSTQALEQLQITLEASSSAEVIRLALQTMAKIVEEARQGSRLVIERADGEKVEILLPLADAPLVKAALG